MTTTHPTTDTFVDEPTDTTTTTDTVPPTEPDGRDATVDPATDVPDGAGEAPGETALPVDRLLSLPVDSLEPHPDNPRAGLGDLDELARSIKAHGVLQPLVVLPAGEDGRHLIVTGHRRHAAAVKAKQPTVPAIVRDLTPTEVVEAFLIENGQRSDLKVTEEVRAIERLMDLSDGKLTPAKLCKRIGRAQAWVRTRMAICALPPRWRDAIDAGELTLAAGEAAASAADLGPEHVEALSAQLAGYRFGDHTRVVAGYRERIERERAYDEAVAKARRRKGARVFTSEDRPDDYAIVTEFLDPAALKEHRGLACHAVLIERTVYGKGVERFDICTDPDSHEADPEPADASDDEGEVRAGESEADGRPHRPDGPAPAPAPKGPDLESPHLKRKGRLARLAYAREVWARPRGGISQAQATRIALRTLIEEAGVDALNFAADILGQERAGYNLTGQLLAAADTPAALARTAAAVALGIAETRMYHGYNSRQCREYLAVLTGAGWDQPDPWTAAVLARQAERDQAERAAAEAEQNGAEPDSVDGNDPSGEEVREEAGDQVRDESQDEPALQADAAAPSPDEPDGTAIERPEDAGPDGGDHVAAESSGPAGADGREPPAADGDARPDEPSEPSPAESDGAPNIDAGGAAEPVGLDRAS